MPVWASASVPYFLYVAAVAVVLRGLRPLARLRACAGAAVGLLLAILGARTDAFWLQLVVLPPMTLLVAYWCSGFLWVAPMERIEDFFIRSDRLLHVPQAAARLPRAVSELLELAYAGVYPLIPIALALHLSYASQPDADHFWTVILITDFICFGMLPWVQTRPPRALDASPPWRSRLRLFNIRLLGETSIGVNTVPSGHAAEAVAVTLLLVDAAFPVGVAMAFAAIAISAGAVLGRYHFALDALAGWLVAIAVWMAI
jgi:hypothetical protein